jgi:CBS domain-containing protein
MLLGELLMEDTEGVGKTSDAMSEEFHVVCEDDALSKAVGIFKDRGAEPTGALIVLDEHGKYRGVLTERMIVRSRLDPKRTKVKAVFMHAPSLGREDSILEAVRLMIENDIKHIPVVEGGKVVGIVTDESIIQKAVSGSFGSTLVKEVMSKEPKVVDEADSIASTLVVMREEGVSRLPVTRRGKLAGIVSMHDIVEHVIKPRDKIRFGDLSGERPRPLSNPIKSIMTKPVITVSPSTSLRDAFQLMLEHKIACLIVLDEGKISGILTKTDILNTIVRRGFKRVEELAAQLSLNRMSVDPIEYERMRADIETFARKYSKYLGSGVVTAYFKQHREKWRGNTLIHCRVTVKSGMGQYAGAGEGWGFSYALKNALEHVERRIMKSREMERDARLAEELLNKVL